MLDPPLVHPASAPGAEREEALEETLVDRDAPAPHGRPCALCGFPVEPGDQFCPACGGPQAPAEGAEAAPDQQLFRCDSCGSQVAVDAQQRSYACPFCDSAYVVQFTPQQTDRQPPEFVIGFAVTPEQAREKFRQWIDRNSWFRPGGLRSAAIADKQQGVYLPFWSFSMLAESDWSATIGEYWHRTETHTVKNSQGKTVTQTRRVRETEWWPLSGHHHRYYSGYLVSGSRGLPQREAERIKPFNLPALRRYQPYFLAGWICEEYSISRQEALQLCQQEFRRREQSQVQAFLPGDTHRGLNVATRFRQINSDLCLLPVYILSYRYRGKLFRFLVNGQTGKAAGDKPLSRGRVAAAIGAAIGAALLLGWLASVLS